MLKDWWLYAEEYDEAGTVQEGETPEEALENAIKDSWDPGCAQVWAYELGELHCLGYRDEEGKAIHGEA